MQLTKHRPIRPALTAVTAVLLGASSANSAGMNHSETSLLVYSERNRVHATEAMFSLDKQLQKGYALGFRFTYDGLTGASPTGASPSKQAQTLTRPSGGKTLLVPAGALPIADGFGETRFAVDTKLSRTLFKGTTIGGGVHLSSEHDYKSLGISGSVTKDLDSARTSLGLSLSGLHDVSKPIGGTPTPLTSIDSGIDRQDGMLVGNGNGRKNVFDGVVSLTRVLGTNLLTRLSYTFDHAQGYLTDPYKVISIVQAPDSADPGEPVMALYENRPSTRTSSAVSCELRTFLLGMITEAEYRYFWDDWGIKSHTASISLKFDVNHVGAFEPHVRAYRQGRASFSKPFLIQGQPLPDYVSADSRLAKFDAINTGLAYTVPTSQQSQLTLAIEWYLQRGDSSPPETFGPLLAFNLFPDLNAIMLRVGLAHDF